MGHASSEHKVESVQLELDEDERIHIIEGKFFKFIAYLFIVTNHGRYIEVGRDSQDPNVKLKEFRWIFQDSKYFGGFEVGFDAYIKFLRCIIVPAGMRVEAEKKKDD